MSSARCRTFFRNIFRLLSWAFSRPWRSGFDFALRDAYLKSLLDGWESRTGEDWESRRGNSSSVLGFLGESGGLLLLCPWEGLMGDDDRGEETAGLCGDEKSRLNICEGIVASISSGYSVHENNIGKLFLNFWETETALDVSE